MADNANVWYEKQRRRQEKPWMRHNDSKVAVNPERITTLIELAKEHYGGKCARCGSKKRLTVHHRHYGNIGFERPEDDIVLLCSECHNDLHQRGRERRLNRDDIPYVKPRWSEWLEKIDPPAREESGDKDDRKGGRQTCRNPELRYYPWWRVVYEDQDGQEWVNTFQAKDLETAQRPDRISFNADETVKIVSVEPLGKNPACVTLREDGRGGTVEIMLEPRQRSIYEKPIYRCMG